MWPSKKKRGPVLRGERCDIPHCENKIEWHILTSGSVCDDHKREINERDPTIIFEKVK